MQFFFQPNIITFIEELHSFLISLALVSRWFFFLSALNMRDCVTTSYSSYTALVLYIYIFMLMNDTARCKFIAKIHIQTAHCK